MWRGGDGDDVAMRTTMWSKLDCGEVEDEKTRNGYLQKRRAGSVRARDVRVLDITGTYVHTYIHKWPSKVNGAREY